MKKKHFFAFLLINSCFFSPLIQAGYLADELRFNYEQAPFWNSRRANLIAIEHNLMRKTPFAPNEFKNLTKMLKTNALTLLNQFLQKPIDLHRERLAVSDIQKVLRRRDKIDALIQNLPTLKTESYAGLKLDPAVLNTLQPGDVYYEKGFFKSTGSLHTAYDELSIPMDTTAKAYNTIIKVRGKTPHLISQIYQEDEADMIWSSKSFFKVLNKDYDAVNRVHLLHFKEITKAQALQASRIISPYQGLKVAHATLCNL